VQNKCKYICKYIFYVYLYINKQQLKTTTMNSRITKEKVTAKLIAQGNNPTDVEKMVNLHFDYAHSKYNNMKQVSECIRTIY
jgi:hypothetical protein